MVGSTKEHFSMHKKMISAHGISVEVEIHRSGRDFLITGNLLGVPIKASAKTETQAISAWKAEANRETD